MNRQSASAPRQHTTGASNVNPGTNARTQMRPRRTPQQGGGMPNGTQNGAQRAPQGRYSANVRSAPQSPNGTRNRANQAPQNTYRQPQTQSGYVQNRVGARPVKEKISLFKTTKAWLKKNYSPDKEAIAKREAVRLSLVREKGSIDYMFFILVLILLAFGTVMVYSASYVFADNVYGDSYHTIFRQIIFVILGFIGMFAASKMPPEWFKKLSVPVFLVCLGLLVIVPFPIPGITVVHNGARRWINLGFIEIQPSEFMKLGLAMLLAWYFDRFYERVTAPAPKKKRYMYGVITPLAITGVVCVLVLIEKHLSGTIIMAAIGALLVLTSGAPSFWMLPGVVGAGGILAALIAILPHARKRFEIWQNPWIDPKNAGYQTIQGLYAIGSGGLFGEGLGNSYQKQMYVSMPHNDFIFVIVCEELGFIGAVAVILLFALLVWRGIVIALNAPDVFSQLLTMGIVGKIAIQVVLNIAVVTNTIPNTGISLPFFSYGGSSLIVLMIEMGIVLSVSRYSRQKK